MTANTALMIRPRRGKYPAKPGDGGEATAKLFTQIMIPRAIDCSFAPIPALRAVQQRNRLRRFARPPPGEDHDGEASLIAPGKKPGYSAATIFGGDTEAATLREIMSSRIASSSALRSTV